MDTTETFRISIEVSEVYEAKFVPALFAPWVPHLLDAAGVATGHRVLDVGCGTGIVARGAADRVGEAGSVVGLDLNDAMLTVAARIRPDLDWRQGDAADLPFAAGEFDRVLSQMAMIFFPDPVAALAEMRRVSRTDGVIGVLIPGRLEDSPPYLAFVDTVVAHAGPDARGLVTSYFALGDLERTGALFEAAGLRIAAAASPVEAARYDSIDDFVGTEIDSTPLADRLDAAARAAILADCREKLAGYQAADGVRIPLQCHVLTASPR